MRALCCRGINIIGDNDIALTKKMKTFSAVLQHFGIVLKHNLI
jgi:hypothetical protein